MCSHLILSNSCQYFRHKFHMNKKKFSMEFNFHPKRVILLFLDIFAHKKILKKNPLFSNPCLGIVSSHSQNYIYKKNGLGKINTWFLDLSFSSQSFIICHFFIIIYFGFDVSILNFIFFRISVPRFYKGRESWWSIWEEKENCWFFIF